MTASSQQPGQQNPPFRLAAVIAAAGRGVRAGDGESKQWRRIRGRRVIDWTIGAFDAARISPVVAALPPGELDRLPERPDLRVVAGGDTRTDSVRQGLEALEGSDATHVLIHDAARCCVPAELISRVAAELRGGAEAVAPGLPVSDALWRGDGGAVRSVQSRDGLHRAQTPQGFALGRILEAHRGFGADAADDVEIALAAGLDVRIVPGDERNLKITSPGDFALAAGLLGAAMDTRIGTGFDVHRFGPGDHVTLCGVRIAHERGLEGHSDADVGLHALADAVYGALALGDIGRHFPPDDPQWKDAASDAFLRHAARAAAERGMRIVNMDVTLICERPRIGPHADAMRRRISEIAEIDEACVSVKATTTEGLGFTGREEGIAAQAAVSLAPA